ncbi:hypothetical protein Pla123a_01550 [Posidoniimonas polymericola]|uniref:Uncharacterized protein n=1 Tax=Posidoniimonas polymericola TaxID=2528002 RepID=A0A5C5ZDV1_9BACT|nr:hypothetical protein [Posidoniimonas polymericola]TWT85348.1 hypothetical protein Pla123a_01550 [Posidoniimonas polymericola]
MQRTLSTLESPAAAPGLMLAGVGMVALAALGSGLAELTGVALIALGAGVSLVARVSSERRLEWLLLHAAVYGSVYLLFLGARLHADGLTPLLAADAAGSVFFLAVLARLVVRSS